MRADKQPISWREIIGEIVLRSAMIAVTSLLTSAVEVFQARIANSPGRFKLRIEARDPELKSFEEIFSTRPANRTEKKAYASSSYRHPSYDYYDNSYATREDDDMFSRY